MDGRRRSGIPPRPRQAKRGSRRAEWARTLCGDFGPAKQGAGSQGGVGPTGPRPNLSGFEGHLQSISTAKAKQRNDLINDLGKFQLAAGSDPDLWGFHVKGEEKPFCVRRLAIPLHAMESGADSKRPISVGVYGSVRA